LVDTTLTQAKKLNKKAREDIRVPLRVLFFSFVAQNSHKVDRSVL